MTTYHVGDTKPDLTAVCTSDGAPVDLTGATVKFHLRKPDRSILALDATGGADGRVAAAWPEPLDQAGSWQAEVQVTYSDQGVQTFGPQTFVVATEIA